MHAVEFIDCAENMAQIIELIGSDICVSYENPDDPFLIFAIGDVESIVPAGSWIVKTDDGCVFVMDEDMVRQAVLEYVQKYLSEFKKIPPATMEDIEMLAGE